MSKILLTIILSLVLVLPLAAQQEDGEAEVASEAGVADSADSADTTDETAAPDEAATPDEAAAAQKPEQVIDPDFADTELDVQTYEEDDDDFVPSEEIPADEPIPFPSNI